MKYQDIPIQNVIEKMKERISSNQMSLLVGSGASCCACDLYQSWVGLVSDMVAFLYPDELERKGIEVKQVDGYYCHYNLTRIEDPKDKDYVYDTIKAIVNREGVLEIPSLFAKRMGVRESIEAYIESHTPRIDVSANNISLFGESSSIDKERDFNFLSTMVNVGWNAIFTTNYDDLLKYASSDVGKKSLTECSDAATLSLRKMDELVIKLHGSIDFDHVRNGFDGDVHRKYVLTREDYEDYPSKHEAFMQLMRISLLKDCFCLVGFSGTDPNFIAWITWVRDILEAKKSTTSESVEAKDIKIFFIDCFDKTIDEATAQFFDNHKIYRIILPADEVRVLIDPDRVTPKDSDEYRRYIYTRLFSYITKDEALAKRYSIEKQESLKESRNKEEEELEVKGLTDYTVSQSKSEVKVKGVETYKELPESYTLWSQAYTLSGNFHRDSTIKETEANELLSMSSHMRIVRGTHYQSYYLDSIPFKAILTELEARLALLAFEQQMYVGEDEVAILKQIKNALKDKESRDRILKLENRRVTLRNPDKVIVCKTNTDRVIHERCLRLAFTFDFLRLKEELLNWNPSSEFAINKAVLLSLVDHDACCRMLTTDMLEAVPTRIERYRATQLANILLGDLHGRFSTKDFTSLSSDDLFSLRDWFFGKSLQTKERVQSYGNNDSPNTINEETALRSLLFLIETPAFVQLGVWSIVDNAQWYKVAHKLFEKYPFPVMFYSTTMNDTNTLRRIGQDYAYSKKLHKLLPGLVDKMFSLLTDKRSPLGFWGRKNFCTLLEELIKAVPSKYWDKYILQLWNVNKEQIFEDGYRTDELYKLICAGLLRTDDVLFSATVISDTLEKVRQNKKYDLAQNLFYYSRTKHNKTISSAVNNNLVKFIDGICDVRDYILLGNLNRILSKTQIKKISKSISRVLQNSEFKTSSINGLVFFAKHDNATLSIVRKAIITNPSLWDNGAHEGGGWSPCEFLSIVDLDNELKWTKDEVKLVYEKLVASAKQILPEKDSMMSHFMNREKLYSEMLHFIDLHRSELEDVGSSEIYQQLDTKFKELTSFDNIEKSIYSDNEDAISAALEALGRRIKHEGIVEHFNVVNTLITRILCKNKNGYQSILDYLQYYVRFFAKDKETLRAIPQLLFLMDNLTMDVFKELEQNVLLCTELTILIAMHLQEYGISCEGVNYWMGIKKSNFFNWSICNTRE